VQQNTLYGLVALGLCWLALSPSVASAQSGDDVSLNLSTSVQSTYVFRGQAVYTDRTTPLSSSSASVAFKGLGPGQLSFSARSGVAMTNQDKNESSWLELDVMSNYQLSQGDWTWNVGYLGYLYPDSAQVAQAHEGTLQVTHSGDLVQPSLYLAIEPILLKGFYAAASFSRSFQLWRTLSWSSSLSLGAEDYQGSPLQAADANLNNGLNLGLPQGFYAQLGGNVSANLRRHMTGRQRPTLWGGLTVGISQ
jgi:hypothetical protein